MDKYFKIFVFYSLICLLFISCGYQPQWKPIPTLDTPTYDGYIKDYINLSNKPKFKNGFSFSEAEYSMIAKELDFQNPLADGHAYGIRFYPALNAKDSLYLVLVSEVIDTTKPDDPNKRIYNDFPDKNLCIVNSNNQPSTVVSDPKEKDAIRKDIISYQSQYIKGGLFSDSSLSSFAYTGYTMIQDFKRAKPLAANEILEIIMIPAYRKSDKTLLFVTQAQIFDSQHNQRKIHPELGYYNAMDECPRYCPNNSIHE